MNELTDKQLQHLIEVVRFDILTTNEHNWDGTDEGLVKHQTSNYDVLKLLRQEEKRRKEQCSIFIP